jgi:hypothetical protein
LLANLVLQVSVTIEDAIGAPTEVHIVISTFQVEEGKP